MKDIILGKTGIKVPQNGFGALPIQRVSIEEAVRILRKAYDGGMRFFDTARAYSDSEIKLGEAFGTGYIKREDIIIATKTAAKTPEEFWKDLDTSLANLKTEYIDIYQLHMMPQCFKPGDGTGLYECLVEAKRQGKIRHIGGTAHKLGVAKEIIESGLYETLQYPMSYLATDKEVELIHLCNSHDMGFISMKGLAGGLITNSKAAMAFISQFDGAVPIWGIQRESELDEWLAFMDSTPTMDDSIKAFIEKERKELMGDFCRGCGYCMPCTVGIQINQCNRMSLMLRRAPSASWLNEYWQAEMEKINDCIECGKCMTHCPYELQIPTLLRKNLEDYHEVLAGNRKVQ
ncbi:aldo/keto reductase [Pseudobutyrivibrio ruminis]|uniref:Predicted oxidoreductase of the aldo/keto reductase family n=1 Tax=Pseudobutyrivibrio ruminis DSM 9787 TaxID=1123011 RepID=A0A285SSH7_9FIRM|nr:aldo/keto reductase [Pseudobutyrivibrio ruminis]SOC09111.1 Predicted oxidoreductase of the aldo/keto reductase family [Pseudobutyrivibrio ruminis DSM 9787]